MRFIKKSLKLVFAGAGGNGFNEPITSSEAELNNVDGDVVATPTTVVDADSVVYNDAGVMKQVAMSDLKTYMTAQLAEVFFPVGSIYSNTLGTNPNTLLGFGTWVAFGEGKFPISADATYVSEATGGDKDAIIPTHTHTDSFYTSTDTHKHTQGQRYYSGYGNTYNNYGSVVVSGAGMTFGANSSSRSAYTSDVSHSHTVHGAVTGAVGGESVTDKNMPPYIGVYMWKRTA